MTLRSLVESVLYLGVDRMIRSYDVCRRPKIGRQNIVDAAHEKAASVVGQGMEERN